MEEFRRPEIQEFNFRVVLQDHLARLLKDQRTCWKQRATIKWVKFGDENTKFFHAHATLKFRRNHVQKFKDNSGNDKFGHSKKALILWDSYKERLGTS